jgi:hypothetical protein
VPANINKEKVINAKTDLNITSPKKIIKIKVQF